MFSLPVKQYYLLILEIRYFFDIMYSRVYVNAQ